MILKLNVLLDGQSTIMLVRAKAINLATKFNDFTHIYVMGISVPIVVEMNFGDYMRGIDAVTRNYHTTFDGIVELRA
jgi:hypothetical protein